MHTAAKRKAQKAPKLNIPVMLSIFSEELIIDNFCGGGGVSYGIKKAIGRCVDYAINHSHQAIRMHTANHPETYHFCEDVRNVVPYSVTKGRPVALVWLSPDCTHHSKAKGDKPVNKKIRGLAWVGTRWAATVRPRVLMLENVEEFKDWGPLLPNNRPNPKKKGRTFKSFVRSLTDLGYEVEYRELVACDYGAPTTRKRFFLIARCDGEAIVWPEATHAHPDSPEVKAGLKKPWRTAAEVIDWSLPCASIFNRKKPLAENTMRRIAKGVMRFVVNNPNPFIISTKKTAAAPFIVGTGGPSYSGKPAVVDKPLGTIVAENHRALVVAFLSKYHGETAASRKNARGQTPDEPIRTIDTANRFSLVTSYLIKLKGTNLGQPATEPLQTITAGGNHFGEVRAFLIKYYGSSTGQDLTDPLHTITTKDTFGLVMVYGELYQIVDIRMRMLQPNELYAAQGFGPEYIIDRDHTGRKFTKAVQVRMCGNSVPPVLPESLVRANLPEMCVWNRNNKKGAIKSKAN